MISSKVLRWAIMGFYAGLIFLVSSMNIQIGRPGFFYLPYLNHLDKCIHFIVYGLFCTLLCWAISAHLKDNQIPKWIFIAVIVTSLYGITDEVHQLFVPTRTGTAFDWLADTAGAAIAGLCWLKIYPARKARK